MTVSDLILFAPGPDIKGGIVNQAFDSEFAAHLSLPIPIPIAATVLVDKGPVDFENGGAIFDHGSGGIVLLRAA